MFSNLVQKYMYLSTSAFKLCRVLNHVNDYDIPVVKDLHGEPLSFLNTAANGSMSLCNKIPGTNCCFKRLTVF